MPFNQRFSGQGGSPYIKDSGSPPSTAPVVSGSTDGLAIGASAVSTGSTGAIAVGNSYASGASSFAVQIGNNTASFGAQGFRSIAMGSLARATNTDGIAIGSSVSTSSNTGAAGIGVSVVSSGLASLGVNQNTRATGSYTFAHGYYSQASQYGQKSHAAGRFANNGDAQSSTFILRQQTANATPASLLLDGTTASSKAALADNSTWTFSVLVVGRSSGGASAGYKLEGVIERGSGAATTALVGSVTKTALAEDNAAWDVSITADTTNGALDIQVTGAAATDIRWVARLDTVEVIY